MPTPSPKKPCHGSTCGCSTGGSRRDFLKLTGLAATSAALTGWPALAGPEEEADFAKLVPADKQLHPDWVKSLFARGAQTRFAGLELEKIGMPVGGVCAGQLYLGGDGKLWHWDIFNQHIGTNDAHYAKPMAPSSPVDQGFALRLKAGGQTQVRTLDRAGFPGVSFVGEYPIGTVEYRDPALPVVVTLEAFSPFIPLNVNDSSLPATVMQFTLRNTSKETIKAEIAGWLQNAVCLHTGRPGRGRRRNRLVHHNLMNALECTAEAEKPAKQEALRPDILFEDFEKETYEGWTATGTAFGPGPVEAARMPAYQGEVGAHGKRLVNTHNTRNAESVGGGDAHTGSLTSKPFVIERHYITFLIGGGDHKDKTCLNLLVQGKVVASATGKNDNRMGPQSFDARAWEGMTAQLQIVDNETGAWGNIGVDDIVLSDQPRETPYTLSEQSDFGTMVLGELIPPRRKLSAKEKVSTKVRHVGVTSLPPNFAPEALFAKPAPGAAAQAVKPFGEKLVGALARQVALKPGQEKTVTFLLAWHFPNLRLPRLPGGRYYAQRFGSATAVAEHVARNFDRLRAQTRLWHQTWYESTLPRWLLDRTFLNTSILATSTCHWFRDGRFYAWEGVGCCEGTCAHVWQYAHAVARLFPQLERSAREMADYGAGFEAATGRIRFRAEHNDHWAVDGQAGCILRAYREHQMSADDQFLRRVWPRVKKSLEFLIGKDGNGDGVIEGPQHNTLDADWFGPVAWLSGLYLAALRAGEEMALELGDDAFAAQARAIFEVGRKKIVETLWNGEYFIQKPDPSHLEVVGSYSGCSIDQVFGQSWAHQVALGRILPEEQTQQALRSLWRYNFAPDVGPYRQVHKAGRWYAMPGEAGLLMVTHPHGQSAEFKDHPSAWSAMYFNECMNGFEYQVAGHMIWEGMLLEGLAVTRAIHDRYSAARRNPWNEIECGDHYARSMASYGVFLAACGYEYHGPKGHLGFAPRIAPEDFKGAFTAAEGWGVFSQKIDGATQRETLELRWGKLRLRSLAFGLTGALRPAKLTLTAAGQPVAAAFGVTGGRVEIRLQKEVQLKAGEALEVWLA